MSAQTFKLVDNKTGEFVKVFDILVRKNYKGRKLRYEVMELLPPHDVRVRKLEHDQWVYLCLPAVALQCKWTLL